MFIDEVEVKQAIHLIRGDNDLFELRIVSPHSKLPASGYFKDINLALDCLKKYDLKDKNVYIVLNPIKEECYSRVQRDMIMERATSTTQDRDIEAREWLLIDLDPRRASDTSSSEEQVKKTLEKCGKVHNFLLEQHFPRPVIGFSGNGYHLLYKIRMKNNDENKKLINDFLKTLDQLFSDDEVEIDTSVGNASRISKLYGTTAQKGLDTPERPHRMSKIISIPEELDVLESSYIKRICNMAVKAEATKPDKYNNYSGDFDLEEWLDKYSIGYKAYNDKNGTKYCLDCCPFDSNHKGKDAAIFKMANGAIGFKCFHNSCADKTWHDVRELFEPDAYAKRRQLMEKQAYQSFNRNAMPEPKHIVPKEGEPVFLTIKEILEMPNQAEELIKTGITLFDKKFRGLRKKDVTIISGQTGSAKSTLLSQIALNAVDDGNRVAVFSGELIHKDFARWIVRQAAGIAFVEPTEFNDYYRVPDRYKKKIGEWFENRLWLYNNAYGRDYNAVIEQFEKRIDDAKLDMLCLDNLMAFNISDLSKDKYEAQSKFAWQLHELAQRKNVHIIVVCHPRKPTGLMTQYDISGSSDIINAVDNVIFTYRVSQLFENSYAQFFQKRWDGSGTNVWHCDKARNGSVDDSYNDLFYEIETKRLKNDEFEARAYGWCDPKGEVPQMVQASFRDVKPEDGLPWEDLDTIPFE